MEPLSASVFDSLQRNQSNTMSESLSPAPSIEFFDGLFEDLSGVSLRRDRQTGAHIALLVFEQLKSIEQFNSYRKRFSQALRLTDSEGQILLQPSSVQFIFGGSDGDELKRVECKIKIDQDDHWQRFLRFMERYAEANGMAYGEPEP
jgi:photosystem II Psb28-2 protein